MASTPSTLCEGSACSCTVCQEANVFSGGSINRPRAAQEGPILESPDSTGCSIYILCKSPPYKEASGMHRALTRCSRHVSEHREVAHRDGPPKELDTRKYSGDHTGSAPVFAVSLFVKPIQCCSNTGIYLSANKQAEQWRAPLTVGATNQRSPVAKLLNQVQKRAYL